MEERLRSELLLMMSAELSKEQMEKLGDALTVLFQSYHVEQKSHEVGFYDNSNERLKKKFIASLRLEGKSEQTLDQYELAINLLFLDVDKRVEDMVTNDIRYHLAMYQQKRKVSKSTIDNKRRNLSSFFAWLTREEYIEKNPMLRIKKIKTEKVVRKPFNDNEIERIKNATWNKRDRAIIEFMLTTGCRVSEIVNLNWNDIDMIRGEAIVFGKGSKERKVYISDKALYYIGEYLKERTDCNESLFVNRFGERLSKQSIEKMLKKISEITGINNVHPHRFRRTFATNALNKGMKIQHLQAILGHSSLDTTMLYCSVDEDNVKIDHKKVA